MMINPFTDSSNISIRLIRKGDGSNEDGTNDDRIAIVYNGDDSYILYYRDANAKEGMTHTSVLTGDELDTYLQSLFYLLTHDKDPFCAVQFNIPCMPCIFLSVEDLRLKGVKRTLYEILPLMSSCLKTSL
jgi:hypothetical protein